MGKTFIEKLMKAKSLKIRGNPVGGPQIIKVTPAVLSQAKDMTFQIVSFDKNVPVDVILKNPSKYDKAVESTFKAYLEGYAESMIPAANPARHRGEAAIRVLDSFNSPNKGFFKENFPHETNTEREIRAGVLKSGLYKVIDIFIEGVAKIPKSTTEDSKNLTQADLGMNFAEGLKGKEAAALVMFNQYYFKTLVIWMYVLTSKMYELQDNEIRPYLMEKLQDKTIGELRDKNFSQNFFNEIKIRALRSLQSVYLPDTIK